MTNPKIIITVDQYDFDQIQATDTFQVPEEVVSGFIEMGSVIQFECHTSNETFQRTIKGMFPSLDFDDGVLFLYFGESTPFAPCDGSCLSPVGC